MSRRAFPVPVAVFAVLALMLTGLAGAQEDPEFTSEFECRNWCTAGTNPYFPLWPGYALVLEGEVEDEGETLDVKSTASVLYETEVVHGVTTRVFEERELEDGELVEVSRNFVALCRETGDVWYFGEDVDDYEDGVIVGHEGAWRAGVNGAVPGILMPGSPILGARYFEEMAPGVALDQAEIIGMGEEVTVPFGTFTETLETVGTTPLDPSAGDEKFWARGVGNIVDQDLELVDVVPPPCQPDATTHCLNDGRFRVQAEWEDAAGNEGEGNALAPCDDSGEFWFFSPNNTELIVKVLDACGGAVPGFDSFWVFAGGLTDVEVTLTVTDTFANETRVYENDLGKPFAPVTDTSAFFTCDAVPPGEDDDDDDGGDDDDDGGGGGEMPLADQAFFIEINDTDGDAGVQLFLDGEGWDSMELTNPDGDPLFEITATGSIGMQGVTELFFESAEPSFEEQSLEELLMLFPEGDYDLEGETTDDVTLVGTATLTHALPAGPVLVLPAEDDEDVDPDDTVIEWMPVADPPGSAIISYEVIVETNEGPHQAFKADMGPGDTTVRVPPEFMQAATAYKFEVLAKEASGNQTISEREFATEGGAIPEEEDGDEEEEEEEIELDDAAIFIEINDTDGDAGIQLFLDGEGWDFMGIEDPDGDTLLEVTGTGSIGMQGITEFFFESAEPSFEEQSLAELLALFPEGVYDFEGTTTDGVPLVGEATLTHALPAGPILVLPAEGAEDVDPENTVIEWMPVADPPGSAIVSYEVIVEKDEGALRVFKADMGPGATTVTVPPEFMEADTDYKFEVLAKETSGNQTISEREFATADDEGE